MIASLITALYLLEIIDISSATTSLYVAGVMLLVAEIAIISFGLLAFNGLIALYAAFTLQRGTDYIFGISIGWPTLFGIAFVEFFIIFIVISIHVWLRRQKTTTGIEGMIGAEATVLSWDGKSGTVRVEGEIWKAIADNEMDFEENEQVKVKSVGKMQVTVTA